MDWSKCCGFPKLTANSEAFIHSTVTWICHWWYLQPQRAGLGLISFTHKRRTLSYLSASQTFFSAQNSWWSSSWLSFSKVHLTLFWILLSAVTQFLFLPLKTVGVRVSIGMKYWVFHYSKYWILHSEYWNELLECRWEGMTILGVPLYLFWLTYKVKHSEALSLYHRIETIDLFYFLSCRNSRGESVNLIDL